MRSFAVILFAALFASAVQAQQPDYEREKRWSDQIVPAVLVGDVVWIKQKSGHEFLAIYTQAEKPRGAVIIGHGRGWNPDFELYGALRVKLAEQGYTTLAIQLPVLGPATHWPPDFCRTRGSTRSRSCPTASARRWRTSTSFTQIPPP